MKSWTTYYMQSEIDGSRMDLIDKLEAAGFRPIDVDAGKSSSHGWAYSDDGDPITVGAEIDRILVDPVVALAVRFEEVAVPAAVFRREVRKRLDSMGKCTREEERAIKDDVRANLRRRALPDVTIVQVIINEPERRVYVGPCSASLREQVVTLVEKLGTTLVIQSPFAAAVVGLDGFVRMDAVADELLDLAPTMFAEV